MDDGTVHPHQVCRKYKLGRSGRWTTDHCIFRPSLLPIEEILEAQKTTNQMRYNVMVNQRREKSPNAAPYQL